MLWHNFSRYQTNMPSTVIRSFSYSKADQRLRVVFVSGKVYDYFPVPESLYEEMKQSFSKGTFFNEVIKPNYECEKVGD